MKPNESVSPTYEELEAKVWHLEAVLKSLTPSPIEEAPRDGRTLILFDPNLEGRISEGYGSSHGFCYPTYNNTSKYYGSPTHFIPLSAIQALMESGE